MVWRGSGEKPTPDRGGAVSLVRSLAAGAGGDIASRVIKYVTRFPDGRTGQALLFLRISYAIAAFGVAASLAGRTGDLLFLPVLLAALAMAIGLATRMTALLLGVAIIVAMAMSSATLQLILVGHVGGAVTIALLGPGAYSVDARRYGRRVIQLQSSTPDRGADD